MADASIVFRNKDMQGTPKIHVDTIEGAATLATRFRNASHFVDVINGHDAVALRWEHGSPDWAPGLVKPMKLDVAPYLFERPDDASWDPQTRANLLYEAITCAFEAATETDDYDRINRLLSKITADNLDLWEIVEEGRQCSEAVKKLSDPHLWEDEVSSWMADAGQLFVQGLVEQVALSNRFPSMMIWKYLSNLGVKLADLHAHKLAIARML